MGAGDQLEERKEFRSAATGGFWKSLTNELLGPPVMNLPGLLQANPDLQREHRGAFLFCELAEFIYLFEKDRHEHALQSSMNILEQKYQELLLWYNAALREASGQDLHFPVLQ